MTIDRLPPLRDVISRYDLRAEKKLGQNFLLDLNLTAKIARNVPDLSISSILEIGPGPGGLTRGLLAEGAKKVVAIERDHRCVPALRDILSNYPNRLEIIEGDALKIDHHELVSGKAAIAGNLPYNIGTQLLLNWLTSEPWLPWFSSLTLMFQKEVADRITATPGTKAYGRLSVISQWRCHTSIALTLPARAFTPSPKVDSAVVSLIPKEPEFTVPLKSLELVTGKAFQQRRKMLRASLKSVFQDPVTTLEGLNLDPQARAENLSVQDFARLALAHSEQ